MLANGFGEHNIQGIGDKHIPLIHNVMNTDLVAGISDRATDQLSVLFAEQAGLDYLRARRVPEPVLGSLTAFGLSSVCNILAAVKTAKYLRLGPDDVVLTVAADGAAMYGSERERIAARDFPAGFGPADAAEVFGRWMLGAGTDDLLETTRADRDRIFNLGYYTWVEQQGVSLPDFEARRDQQFWTGLRDLLPAWDAMIAEFNQRTGLAE
jgi:cysteine synthase